MFDVLYHKLDSASIEDVYVILTHMHADPRRKSKNPDLLFLLSL